MQGLAVIARRWRLVDNGALGSAKRNGLIGYYVGKKVMDAPRSSSTMPKVGSSVSQRVKDSILGRDRAIEDVHKSRMPFSPLNDVSLVPPSVNHLSKYLPPVAILVQRPRSLAWRAALVERKGFAHD